MRTIKDLLSSKKFLASLASMVVVVGGHFGFELSDKEVLGIVSPLILYVVGQSAADLGKEKAKVEQQTRQDEATSNLLLAEAIEKANNLKIEEMKKAKEAPKEQS